MMPTLITADNVGTLFEKFASRYVAIPLSLFLDNARYQHSARIIEKAKNLNIELRFLPSY